MKQTAIIHKGVLSYQLIVDTRHHTKHFTFIGSDFADYLEELYKLLGFDVKRTGDGSKNYGE